eukprot:TRINITY_DN54085_c0_g1_i1.p1 TRINITY_DN54085_c0_g1~~TRINITY_DN54085_c0_g1_i1.p1  ORF type:complete len:537 (-),score=83.89 TRINITY_DN54085_c0_g1_i1:122-1732(-)
MPRQDLVACSLMRRSFALVAPGLLLIAGESCPSSGSCPLESDQEALLQVHTVAKATASHTEVAALTSASAGLAARHLFGSNLGGWLCLEDWFFSGPSGRYVSTTDPAGQGTCLPPLLLGDGTSWPSEGVLIDRLAKQYSPTYAVQVLQGHRNSFIGDADLKVMADLGLKVIRVPINWVAFAYALADVAPDVYGKYDPRNESVVVPDPFYKDNISYVTIPHQLLEDLLLKGSNHGLKFLIDIHAFPGGSSDGTYNGIWPNPPKFWREHVSVGNSTLSLKAAGLKIVEAAIAWMEGLTGPAKEALAGFSPMNEPAHLSAFTQPKWARPAEVLKWLGEASELFKRSSLPKAGVHFYMNLIETAFPSGSFYNLTVPWWNKLFTRHERHTWAVFDVHWYTAWGTKAGEVPGDIAIACSRPLEEVIKLLGHQVDSYASTFAGQVDGKKACTEFSASTNADALVACNDAVLTRAWLERQAKSMTQHGIEPFFWSFKMPYGPTFEHGWSLKSIVGQETAPPHPCEHGRGAQLMPDSVPCFAGDC